MTSRDAFPADPADRRLTVIDREQLEATPDEAALIALASAPGLDVDNVEEIASAAGGWVAAIRAAARYADQHPDGQCRPTGSRPQGAAALLGPWLDRLPADRLQFLLDTLALEWLAGPLCDSSARGRPAVSRTSRQLETHGSYLTSCLPPRHLLTFRFAGGVDIRSSRRRLPSAHRWSTSPIATSARRAGSWSTAASTRRCGISWRPGDSRRPGAT